MFISLFVTIATLFTLLYGIKFPRLSVPLLLGIIFYLVVNSPISIFISVVIFIFLVIFNIKALNGVLLSFLAPFILSLYYNTLPFLLLFAFVGLILIAITYKKAIVLKYLIILLSAFIISFEICFLYYLSGLVFVIIFITLTALSTALNKKELKNTDNKPYQSEKK